MVFLYARRDLLPTLEPVITGWFGQAEPFSFDLEHLAYHPTARRLEHGTPLRAGLLPGAGRDRHHRRGDAGRDPRARQGELTDHLIARADEDGLGSDTPGTGGFRGGVVNVKVGDAEKILPSAAGARRVHGLRGDAAHQPPLLQHRRGHRSLLRGALARLTTSYRTSTGTRCACCS